MAGERQAFSERALQIVAENKIRAAIDAGEFDNLPGFGSSHPQSSTSRTIPTGGFDGSCNGNQLRSALTKYGHRMVPLASIKCRTASRRD